MRRHGISAQNFGHCLARPAVPRNSVRVIPATATRLNELADAVRYIFHETGDKVRGLQSSNRAAGREGEILRSIPGRAGDSRVCAFVRARAFVSPRCDTSFRTFLPRLFVGRVDRNGNFARFVVSENNGTRSVVRTFARRKGSRSFYLRIYVQNGRAVFAECAKRIVANACRGLT